MSVVTFWSNGREQTGKTLSIAAISTYIAIEHNYRILIISTGYKDETLKNCFWKEKKIRRNLGLFGPNTNISLEDGISGFVKVMNSNKISPESITNYTKIIFKDRLEILQSFKGTITDYETLKKIYPDIINLANKYYDLVLVDLDNEIEQEISDVILSNSNLVIANISQRLSSINRFLELRKTIPVLNSKKTLVLVGRHDKFSKYTVKNISRYMNEKNEVLTMPYNTLFFEACEEAKVPELFFNIKSLEKDERNSIFVEEVKRASENIIYRLQDLAAMKM